jgi:hypothetical protein
MTTDLGYLVAYQVVLETKGNSLGSSLTMPLLGMNSKADLKRLQERRTDDMEKLERK